MNDAIIPEILAAFADTKYPEDGEIFIPGISREPTAAEREDLFAKDPAARKYMAKEWVSRPDSAPMKCFFGKTWQEVDLALLSKHSNCGCLNAKGAAYFCPAFLLAMIRHGYTEEQDTFFNKFVFDKFGEGWEPPDNEEGREGFKPLLTTQQALIVRKFIEYIAVTNDGEWEGPATLSLRGSWKDFPLPSAPQGMPKQLPQNDLKK